MADEPTAAPTAEVEAPPEPQAEQPAADTEQPEPIDWDDLQGRLERAYEADPKGTIERLKKHRAVGGLAGSIAERQLAQLKQQDDHEREAEAARRAREDLRKLAQEKPLEFADMFLSHDDANQARERIANVERSAAKQIMEQIGEAYHGLPEWQELTDAEKVRLKEAVEQAPDNPLPAFNRVALDIVADRRAEKRLLDRLPKEREAWRKEAEAERLTSEQGPDLRRPSSTTRRPVNWQAMSDEDFAKYWKQRYNR